MALIDITPLMTSLTTPTPYVVSASSFLNSTVPASNAFDNNAVNTWWHSAAGSSQWIKLDYGAVTKVSAFSIRNNGNATSAPKNFIIYGSNDDSVYEKILECNNEVMWSTNGEQRLYRLNSSVNFRYYKLVTSADNGYGYIVINEIKFYQDDSAVIPPVVGAKASLLASAPHASTLRLKQIQNDAREFLLTLADDDANYGTLWTINRYGQAQLTKSAMVESELIFDGVANTVGSTYTISQSYKKFKYILIIAGIRSGQAVLKSLLIPTKIISSTITDQFALGNLATTSYYYYLRLGFPSETTFNVNDRYSVGTGWTDAAISKIYGIY